MGSKQTTAGKENEIVPDSRSLIAEQLESDNLDNLKCGSAPLTRNYKIQNQRSMELRLKAQDALKNHKIFTIRDGFDVIRRSLEQRGWVEKFDVYRRTCAVKVENLEQDSSERNTLSRLLEHRQVDFLWMTRKDNADWVEMARNPNLILNKFNKTPFTSKEGLCNILRDSYWVFEEGKSEIYFPRSYNAWIADDLAEFIDDYRLTACVSMLRILVDRYGKTEKECVFSENGRIPLASIQFAIKQFKTYLRSAQHLDIDEATEQSCDIEWEQFLKQFYMLTQENEKFRVPDDSNLFQDLMDVCRRCIEKISLLRPHSNLDGMLNIWIVKPANMCRGQGILLMNDIESIISYVSSRGCEERCVVQKYIERPMIIYKCKFDIRQWFLVTNVQPLIIWMYRESYLRFSSQEYDLVNFHESVHLTNHAIQKHYENGNRDERLPRENMWDCYTFQAYLEQIGKASMWSERIFPGMQRALIGTMLASQDSMDRRPNTFELYGADFMISEDGQPWLIEINASPDLGASTSVTARLCPQCLEDVIKVVIDYRNDPTASTGSFEMIYRQVIPLAPAYLGLKLSVEGTRITKKKIRRNKNQLKSQESNSKTTRRISSLTNRKSSKNRTLSPRSSFIYLTNDGNAKELDPRRVRNFERYLESVKENVLKMEK